MPVGEPALAQVFGAVVQDVAAQAERPEVFRVVVARVVIEVGTGQIDAGGFGRCAGRQAFQRRQLQRAALA